MDILNDLLDPLFGFFNSLIGSIVLFGLMLMLLMLCLLLLRQSRRKQALAKGAHSAQIEPTLEAVENGQVESGANSAADFAPRDSARNNGPAEQAADGTETLPVSSEGAKGFSFFRRKKSKGHDPAKQTGIQTVAETAPTTPEFDGTNGEAAQQREFLNGLEQEMLATRQLYLNGHISKDVYIAETRALYEKAQQAE